MKFNVKSRKTKRILTVSVISIIFLIPCLAIFLDNEPVDATIKTQDSDIESLLWRFGKGLPGEGATMKPRAVNFIDGGEKYIVIGTDGGLATITTDGLIEMSYITFGEVIDFKLIDDISGDGQKDIVLITYDNDHANVMAISSSNGEEMWKYAPKVSGYDSETYVKTEFITKTWDIEILPDITDDGISDVVISSWYRIIALNGKDGDEEWINSDACTNDVWELEILDDKVIAGSEAGELVALDSDNGDLEWISDISPTQTVYLRDMATIVEEDVSASINDIEIVGDNILFSADDGFLYIASGDDGSEEDSEEIYEIPEYEDPVGSTQDATGSPYGSYRRLFQSVGFKIFETIDVDQNGQNDFMAIGYHLEYTDDNFNELEDVEVVGVLFSSGGSSISVLSTNNAEFEYTQEIYPSSYPELVRVSSVFKGYLHNYQFQTAGGDDIEEGVLSINFESEDFDSSNAKNIVNTGNEREDRLGDTDASGKYLANIGDINDDGVDELFAIDNNGRYFVVDCRNEKTLWMRTKSVGGTELTQIDDINGDGVKDFLYKKIGNFDPSWRDFEGSDIEIPCWWYYNFEENLDELEKQDIILEFLTLDPKTGRVIWEFNVPNANYYEGLRGIENLGDFDGDNIDDYVGWMVPSSYPQDISDYIESLTGSTSVSYSQHYENEDNNYYEDQINALLLSKYTKLVAINGSNGEIFYNRTLVDVPYRYYRDFGHSGSYTNPTGNFSNQDDHFLRTYKEIDSTWYSGNRDNITWESEWDITTLAVPSEVNLEKGSSSSTFFDLWGKQGNNHTITGYNNSALVVEGNSANSTSEATYYDDSDNWVVESETQGSVEKISLEMSFNQSINIQSSKKYLKLEYIGYLSDQVDNIDMYIYNFTASNWNKLTASSINSTTQVNFNKIFDDIDDLIIDPVNETVKIKIEAIDQSSFSLIADKLILKYIYEIDNYTAKAEQNGGLWQSLINVSIPLEFGNDYHQLSQYDRLAALKMQTHIKVNESGSDWYNYSYEFYHEANNEWIVCNWSSSDNWWKSKYNYTDLHGDYRTSPRTGYNSFDLGTSGKRDDMYVITRGTNDTTPGVHNGVFFDYENKTTLSEFVGSDNNIRIRLNVTNSRVPFNVTFDTFGVGAFYWGLYSNQYDNYYVYNYQTSAWRNYEGADNINDILLTLKIMDFDVINGTGDECLDVIVTTVLGCNGWSSRLILYDIKNDKVCAKWDQNSNDIVPNGRVGVTVLNYSTNGWILSGSFSGSYLHKFISDAEFDSAISNYDDYAEPTITYQGNPIVTSGTTYEIPGIVEIKNTGEMGLILGNYPNGIGSLRIVDLITHQDISTITSIGDIDNLIGQEWRTPPYDFSYLGAYYKIKFSYADFNGDGYLDHVASAKEGEKVLIFNGNLAGADVEPMVELYIEDIIVGERVDRDYQSQSFELARSFTLPFASCGDVNDDGKTDGIIGVQTGKGDWDDELRAKGAILHTYDISASSGTDTDEIELSLAADDDDDDSDGDTKGWELESFVKTYEWDEARWEFFSFVENVGDFDRDGHDDILCGHNTYTRYEDQYAVGEITELLNVKDQKIFYRFNLETIDAIHLFDDINDDGKEEFIIQSGEGLYCVNSEFMVEIKSPEDEDKMSSRNFVVEWDTDAEYDYFELVVDGQSHGATENLSTTVSLGPGDKTIRIFMYDEDGIVIAVDEIIVTVPADFLMWILTFLIIGTVAALAIVYKVRKKKMGRRVLIDIKPKSEGIKK